MIIWFAITIPIILIIICLYKYKHEIKWWEIFIPIFVSLIFITIFKLTVDKIITTDTEYQSSIIVKARRNGYWETWISKKCPYQVCTGAGKTRVCHTYYRDCSYCQHNDPEYYAYDNRGNKWKISDEYYHQLKKQWNVSETFVELNRSINYHGNCGVDGDAYDIFWNKDVNTVEPSVFIKKYENRVKTAHRALGMPYISDSEAEELGLYQYPDFYDFYKQNSILGIDSLYNQWQSEEIKRKIGYLNSYWSPQKDIKIFILLFFDQPSSIAKKQKYYWDGGNDNELVICIGMNKDSKLVDWIDVFSWTPEKDIISNLEDDLSSMNTLDINRIYNSLNNNISEHWKKRDFKEFNYLTVEPPLWAIITTYLVTAIISIVCCMWVINNEHQ